MQKIATRIFIISSIAFGVFGILMVFIPQDSFDHTNILFIIDQKLLLTSVFVLLPSFALAVAGRFLSTKK